jgi:hypothetical protein
MTALSFLNVKMLTFLIKVTLFPIKLKIQNYDDLGLGKLQNLFIQTSNVCKGMFELDENIETSYRYNLLNHQIIRSTVY